MTKKKIQKKFRIRKERVSKLKKIQNKNKFNSKYEPQFTDFDSTISLYKDKIIKSDEGKKNNINLSFFNMIYNYLKDCPCAKRIDIKFNQKFIEIIYLLSLDENEFILWTLLIDKYVNINDENWNLVNIFYLAIFSKNKLNKNYEKLFNLYKDENNEFEIWLKNYKEIVKKEITLSEFNERYNELNYLKKFQTMKCIDFDPLLNYICPLKNKEEKNNNNKIIKNSIEIQQCEININSNEENVIINNIININNVNIKKNENENNIINNINNNSENKIKKEDYFINNNININSENKLKKEDYFINNNMNASNYKQEDNIYNNYSFYSHNSYKSLSKFPSEENNFFSCSIEGIHHNENLFGLNDSQEKMSKEDLGINIFGQQNYYFSNELYNGNEGQIFNSEDKNDYQLNYIYKNE